MPYIETRGLACMVVFATSCLGADLSFLRFVTFILLANIETKKNVTNENYARKVYFRYLKLCARI